jgi:hypothetical protein
MIKSRINRFSRHVFCLLLFKFNGSIVGEEKRNNWKKKSSRRGKDERKTERIFHIETVNWVKKGCVGPPIKSTRRPHWKSKILFSICTSYSLMALSSPFHPCFNPLSFFLFFSRRCRALLPSVRSFFVFHRLSRDTIDGRNKKVPNGVNNNAILYPHLSPCMTSLVWLLCNGQTC